MQELQEHLENFKDRVENLSKIKRDTHIPTGFTGIDDEIGGLERGCLSLWGTFTGMATKTFFNKILLNIVTKHYKPAAIFDFGEGTNKLLYELFYLLSGQEIFKINSYTKSPFDFHKPAYSTKLSEADLNNIERAILLIEKAPIVIEDGSRFQNLRLLHKYVKGIIRRNKAEIIVIDSLDLTTSVKENQLNITSVNPKKDRELDFLRKIARKNNVHIAVVAPLSKGISFRTGHAKRPQIQDFINIKKPQKYADTIFTTYRPSYHAIPYWDGDTDGAQAFPTKNTLELSIFREGSNTRKMFLMDLKPVKICDLII